MFTYEDGSSEQIFGQSNNYNSDKEGGGSNSNNSYGPLKSNDVVLDPGELIVGVQVEMADDIPRKLGFTILKTLP